VTKNTRYWPSFSGYKPWMGKNVTRKGARSPLWYSAEKLDLTT